MQVVPEKHIINFSGLICGVTGQNQVLVTNCHFNTTKPVLNHFIEKNFVEKNEADLGLNFL